MTLRGMFHLVHEKFQRNKRKIPVLLSIENVKNDEARFMLVVNEFFQQTKKAMIEDGLSVHLGKRFGRIWVRSCVTTAVNAMANPKKTLEWKHTKFHTNNHTDGMKYRFRFYSGPVSKAYDYQPFPSMRVALQKAIEERGIRY